MDLQKTNSFEEKEVNSTHVWSLGLSWSFSTIALEKIDSFGERRELDRISIDTDRMDVKINWVIAKAISG